METTRVNLKKVVELTPRQIDRAEYEYGVSLWYAWGRIDSGVYGSALTLDDGYRFAEGRKVAEIKYMTGKSNHLSSMLDTWDRYVDIYAPKKFAVAVVPDPDVTDLDGLVEDDGTTARKIRAGEWTVYSAVLVPIDGDGFAQEFDWSRSLHAIITESGQEGTWQRPEDIRDAHIREVAEQLIDDAKGQWVNWS